MALGIKRAFILAGGKGERLKPLTNHLPKVLLDVQEKPLLQWNLELCRLHGVRKVVLGVGHLHDQIESFFGDGSSMGLSLSYSVEKTFLGTAGALKQAESHFSRDEKFIMMNGDEVKDIHFEKMNDLFQSKKAAGVLSLAPVDDVSAFGSVQLRKNQVTAFLEKSASPQNEHGLISAGAYLLSHEVFDLIPENKPYSIEKQVFPQLARQQKLYGIACTGQWFPTDDLIKLNRAREEWTTRF